MSGKQKLGRLLAIAALLVAVADLGWQAYWAYQEDHQ